MRMWMVAPDLLCRKHLCGEHVECHMFLGTIKKRKKVTGYLNNNLFEPELLKERHDELANEMVRRGYTHNTPIGIHEFKNSLNNLNKKERQVRVNVFKSYEELLSRCKSCEKIFLNTFSGEKNNE